MKIVSAIVIVAAFLAAALFHTACDVESAAGEVIISPSSVALKKGDSAQFTASGGFEYQWRLEDEQLGMLSTRRGQSTVYTSLRDPREVVSGESANTKPEVQILYADSYIPEGALDTGTNHTSETLRTGEAYITHITRCEVDCDPDDETATP